MTDTPTEHRPAESRFLQIHGDLEAELTYRRSDDVIDFVYTGVPSQLGGQGIAGRIVKVGLAFARAEGLRVRPSCSYVRHYITKHPEYADLID